jgi:3-hydroxyisobutyrate dehydrogenase
MGIARQRTCFSSGRTCEAFVLAEKLGLDAQKLFEISSSSSGQCWSLTSCCPVAAPVALVRSKRGYQGGFSAALMLKNVRPADSAA